MLKAIRFKVTTKEGIFDTTRDVSVWFEHSKDPIAEIEELIKEIKKIVSKANRNFGRPRIDLIGTDTNYNAVDGYRYISEYGYRLERRVWNGYEYPVTWEKEFFKKDNQADNAKLVNTLTEQLRADAMMFIFEHSKVEYKSIV